MNNQDHLNNWDVAFAKYNALPMEIRQALRRNCANLMEEEGCEEIGSSDINHRLYALYRANGESWQGVIAFFLDYINV